MRTGDGRIRFEGSGEFARLVNQRAQAVLGDEVALRRAYRAVWAKSAFVLVWAVGSYLVLLLLADTPAKAVVASVSLGLAAAAIGFCIMHDANHGGYSPSRRINRLAAHSLDLIGGSSYVWAAKHLAHHTYTNVADHDPDIDALPFARFEPSQPRRRWHRYQHLYVWALYPFVTVRWQFFTDVSILVRGSVGRSKLRRPRRWELLALLGGKALFLTWAIAIPLALHPAVDVAAGFAVVSAVASLALTVTFQLSHCIEETTTVRDGDASHPQWHVHQMETTSDFAPRNSLIRWYVGGLNYQIEHHLFPRAPHTLHPRLADLVRAAALECGVPYHAHPTMRVALRSHIRWLREMGAAGELPVNPA